MKFIISLTSLPNRWENIGPCLNSLVNQDYGDFEVHINLPLATKYDGSFNPLEIGDLHPKIKVFWVDDIGPITKVYYTLQRYQNQNQYIISVDDDMVYDSRMITEYFKGIQRNPGCALGFIGLNVEDEQLKTVKRVSEDTSCDILEGYKSVCYNSNMFGNDFFDEFYKSNPFDDPVLSGYLSTQNIPCIVLHHTESLEGDHWLKYFPTLDFINNPISGCEKIKEEVGDYSTTYVPYFNKLNA